MADSEAIPLTMFPIQQRKNSRTFSGGRDDGSPTRRNAGSRNKHRLSDAEPMHEPLITVHHPEERPPSSAQTGQRRSWRSFWQRMFSRTPSSMVQPRYIDFPPRQHHPSGQDPGARYPPNTVKNQKYNAVTFLPLTLYGQFKFFFNLYFLLVALSQLIPALRIGYVFTYFAPLSFVLLVTLSKEAYDDWKRFLRDQEANSQRYARLRSLNDGQLVRDTIPSSRIQVGDIIQVGKDQRVPADMVLLRTSEKSGGCFIRTDQLDGETDWKLRLAVPSCQRLPNDADMFTLEAVVYADPPNKDIHSFLGTFERTSTLQHPDERGTGQPTSEPLSVENTLWMNTVVASGTALGLVIYTGRETRAVMNTSFPGTKIGQLDLELNSISKILCAVTLAMAFTLVALNQFNGIWYIYMLRFLIVFSSIIPISLRVNLDLAKTFYSFQIMRDRQIPETIVRTSTIPEELGRIQYLLSDKTGTLTKNDMELRKLHMGTMNYGPESLLEIRRQLDNGLANLLAENNITSPTLASPGGSRPPALSHRWSNAGLAPQSSHAAKAVRHRDISARLADIVTALALCHNVTPVSDENASAASSVPSPLSHLEAEMSDEIKYQTQYGHIKRGSVQYQASSPDEVAIVRWTEQVGMMLVYRDMNRIVLKFVPPAKNQVSSSFMRPESRLSDASRSSSPSSSIYPRHPTQFEDRDEDAVYFTFDILHVFPFTSETKRMGIIIRDCLTGEISFFMKGADVVMSKIVQYSDWLDEECGNMAREGLRTLVIARKKLSDEFYQDFDRQFHQAKVSVANRQENVQKVMSEMLEHDMELLGLTGVEDKLQDEVKSTLEIMRNAGIKIWMLTGDKIETATNIAISSKLVSRSQSIYHIQKLQTVLEAEDELDRLLAQHHDCCLVIDGASIQLYLDHMERAFIDLAVRLPAVVCCRCSPTQKAAITTLIKDYTKKRVCAIGDGGNDVSMIQAADVGVGIVGKEGKQASLAADFSVTQFSFLTRLLLWHGRNSYERSSKLSQFVIHRGLIISIIQAVFSAMFYFAPIALYQGMLLVGYSTVYTMAPVFSLVLDTDVSDETALLYPELYKELTKGRSLSMRTFFQWLLISVYQGGIIMILAILLFEDEFLHIVSITFTALIFNELLMVAFEIKRWHRYMIYAEVVTMLIYVLSMLVLRTDFDMDFILTWRFVWKTAVIILVSAFPLYVIRRVRRYYAPAIYQKLT